MTALYDCSFLIRSAFSVVVLFCIILTSSVVIFAFIKRKKLCFIVNIFSFCAEVFMLALLNEIAEYKIGVIFSSALLNASSKPAYIYVLLFVIVFSLSIYSIIKNKIVRSHIISSRENSDNDYMLCHRAEQLQRDNIRLTEMNMQLKRYGEEMQVQIKQKEILQAKTQIHNGMNKLLMISSRAIESGDKEEIEKAMALWHQDALLLCKEAESEEFSDVMNDITSLARLLNVRLVCENIPEFFDEKPAILFEKSACEAMMNSVKHANADVFEITVTENGFSFSNNGELPNEEIRFGGGLTSINNLAKETGYEMTVECNGKFVLKFRKGNENAV